MYPADFIPDTRYHYFDDFITADPPESTQGKHNPDSAPDVCQRLGLALYPCKCGPSTVLAVFRIFRIDLDLVNNICKFCKQYLQVLGFLESCATERSFNH